MSWREDDLAKDVAGIHRREARARLGEGEHAVDLRPDPARLAQPREPRQLVARAHRRADHAELEEEDALELGRRRLAARGAGDDERAAGAQRAQRVLPGRLADGLEHGVDALGQPGAALERLVGTERDRLLALGRVAARDPDAEAGMAGKDDRGTGPP